MEDTMIFSNTGLFSVAHQSSKAYKTDDVHGFGQAESDETSVGYQDVQSDEIGMNKDNSRYVSAYPMISPSSSYCYLAATHAVYEVTRRYLISPPLLDISPDHSTPNTPVLQSTPPIDTESSQRTAELHGVIDDNDDDSTNLDRASDFSHGKSSVPDPSCQSGQQHDILEHPHTISFAFTPLNHEEYDMLLHYLQRIASLIQQLRPSASADGEEYIAADTLNLPHSKSFYEPKSTSQNPRSDSINSLADHSLDMGSEHPLLRLQKISTTLALYCGSIGPNNIDASDSYRNRGPDADSGFAPATNEQDIDSAPPESEVRHSSVALSTPEGVQQVSLSAQKFVNQRHLSTPTNSTGLVDQVAIESTLNSDTNAVSEAESPLAPPHMDPKPSSAMKRYRFIPICADTTSKTSTLLAAGLSEGGFLNRFLPSADLPHILENFNLPLLVPVPKEPQPPPALVHPDKQRELLCAHLGVRHAKSLDLDELDDPRPPDAKPYYPLHHLVKLAIYNAQQQRLTVREIASALQRRFPWFRGGFANIHNVINNELKKYNICRRVDRDSTDPGVGVYWMLDWEHTEGLNPGPTKARKKTSAKQRSGPAITSRGEIDAEAGVQNEQDESGNNSEGMDARDRASDTPGGEDARPKKRRCIDQLS